MGVLDEGRTEPDAFWDLCKLSGGDGYDAMDIAMKHGWHPVPA